jgi:hypothetical protein
MSSPNPLLGMLTTLMMQKKLGSRPNASFPPQPMEPRPPINLPAPRPNPRPNPGSHPMFNQMPPRTTPQPNFAQLAAHLLGNRGGNGNRRIIPGPRQPLM